jgi:uncharacterized membrane protein
MRLVISQAIVLSVGFLALVSIWAGANTVAALANAGGTVGEAEAAADGFLQPLMENAAFGGILLSILFAVVGSWTLWVRRRHGWVVLVSSLPLLVPLTFLVLALFSFQGICTSDCG